MKKAILFIVILCGFSVHCFSQNYIDILYLKNGSIIKGQILEQIPDESVKIQTYDGSIFVYAMDQVEKIVKENTREFLRERNLRTRKYNPLKGYKGFIDAGYTFATTGIDVFEISTTHGYQFNNYIFLGGGLGLHYYNDSELYSVPIFADFKVNFLKSKVTPFANMKLGLTVGDIEGAYCTIAMGVRFALKKKSALYFSLGYTFQETDLYGYTYDYWPSDDYWSNYYWDYEYNDGISLKIGFEF